LTPPGQSASSADNQDDKFDPANSSIVEGDNPALSPGADGTEAQPGAAQVDDQSETGQGTADAKPKDEREELLAVARKAVSKEKAPDPDADPSPASGKDGTEAAPEAPAGDKRTAEQKADDERFDKHPRFQELRGKIQEFQPKADQWDRVTGFMQEHGLEPPEVAEGFKIMALIRRDPAKAYAALKPYMDKLAPYVGEILPVDLQERYDAGEISEEAAKELATLRAGQQNTEAVTAADRARHAERQATDTTVSRVNAVNAWAASKATEAGFAKIEPLVRDRARAMLAEAVAAGNPPATPEAAVAMMDRALSDIRDSVKQFTPQRPGIRHVPSSGSASQSAMPAANSALEAARQGLQKARSARG